MGSFKGKHFQTALSAIERIAEAKSFPEVGRVLAGATASFGYNHICFLAASGYQQPFEDRVLMKAWPKQWAEQYRSSNFYAYDPVAPRIRQQPELFTWSDIRLDEVSATSRAIMEIAEVDYGLKFGLCMPVHGMNGYQAGLSLSGHDIENTEEARGAIELITMYAFNRFVVLKSRQPAKPNTLTLREREVIRWVAAGKTAWDVSVILGISEDTVNKTATAAMQKLNAHTRAQAVAEAITRGLIAF
jgi:LuxR family quorum sensing-dependent transcriptional regulator